MIVPVILAGGFGSRLWPLSRSAYPKQLLPLLGDLTMLQETVLRAKSMADTVAPLVICHQEHRFLVAEQLQQIGITDASIILEPLAKNTAPAAAVAALYLQQKYPGQDPVLLILPADHFIQEIERLRLAMAIALANANTGRLVTFGVVPAQAETGYGYIKANTTLNDAQAYPVSQFVEKPSLEKAQAYLASGQYYWNSGMFMFQASQFVAALAKFAPHMLAVCQQVVAAMSKDLDFARLDETLFAACPSNSIDYAVMEKTDNAVVVPLDAKWSDVGSWSALWEVQRPDQDGNIIQGDVFAEQVTNSYLRAESRMLAVVGVNDHIIVETSDAVLVAHKNNSQAVKDLVDRLKQKERTEINLHRRVARPWGSYETVDQGDCFQVKRITVKPGASLSLQLHHHRSEHWVVVTGVAEVTRGEEVFTLTANQSTYIPVGVKHRLVNPGTANLEMIEVQSGSYLGEDDIVRFEDVYGRSTSIESSEK